MFFFGHTFVAQWVYASTFGEESLQGVVASNASTGHGNECVRCAPLNLSKLMLQES